MEQDWADELRAQLAQRAELAGVDVRAPFLPGRQPFPLKRETVTAGEGGRTESPALGNSLAADGLRLVEAELAVDCYAPRQLGGGACAKLFRRTCAALAQCGLAPSLRAVRCGRPEFDAQAGAFHLAGAVTAAFYTRQENAEEGGGA